MDEIVLYLVHGGGVEQKMTRIYHPSIQCLCAQSFNLPGVNIFQWWLFFRGEYFSGVNIFQGWIFFREEYFSGVVVEYTLIHKMAQKQRVRPRPLWQNFFHRRNQWTVKLVFWRRFIQVISGHCGKVLWISGAGLGWISRFYSPERKNFPRRDGAAPRGPTRGGSGRAPAGFFGLRTKGFSWDAGRRESRHQERDSGFVPIRAGGRLAGLYAEPTAAGAADSGGQLRALLIRVVR